MELKIGNIGKIIAGDEAGSYIKIIDDHENTGGFLILTSNHLSMASAFDNWVRNEEELMRYFIESAWVIEWI